MNIEEDFFNIIKLICLRTYESLIFRVNEGFEILRSKLPESPFGRKLSKADTLKRAICYIQQLTRMLEDEAHSSTIKNDTDDQKRKKSTILVTSING